jgi:VanZ family protein
MINRKKQKNRFIELGKISSAEIISWILLIAWMGIIISFSSQPASDSGALSKGLVRKIVEFMSGDNRKLSYRELEYYDHLLRKLAHFGIYFVMGFFCSNALYRLRVKKSYWIGISIGICFAFAIVDEFYQSFIPGRGPGIFDVFIDTLGAFLGTLIYTYIKKMHHSRRKT